MTSNPNCTSGMPLLPAEVCRFLQEHLGTYSLMAETNISAVFQGDLCHPATVIKVILPTPRAPFEAAMEYHNLVHAQSVQPSHTTALIDFKEMAGVHCFVMPRYESNLHKLRGLSYDDMILYMGQLLTAMRHLHMSNLVHLDLKPKNILVDWTTRAVRVGDFGMSKLNPRILQLSMATTVTHRAPEHLRHIIDKFGQMQAFTQEQLARMDMWSLGVVFYEMMLKCFKGISMTNCTVHEEPAASQQVYQYFMKLTRQQDGTLKHDPYELMQFVPDKHRREMKRVIHLVRNMMYFQPAGRWTAEEAFNYFYNYIYTQEEAQVPSRFHQVKCMAAKVTGEYFRKPMSDDADLHAVCEYVTMLAVYHHYYPKVNLEDLARVVMCFNYVHIMTDRMASKANLDVYALVKRSHLHVLKQLQAITTDDQGCQVVAAEMFQRCEVLLG